MEGHGDLAWIEMKLSSMLRKEPVLGQWTEPEECLSRPSAGSFKVDTIWEVMRCVRTGFLGCGKWSFFLAQMECKEENQSSASALSNPTFARALCSRARQLQEALESSSLRPPTPASAGEPVGRDVWALAGTGKPRAALAPLTAACARPAGAAGRGHRCARS